MRKHPGTFATVAMGLLFVATGIYTWFYMGRFLDHAREAQAVVIEVRNESATPKGRTHPVVRFTTADGTVVIVRSDEHHNVRPADTVQLVYDPRNPQSIEITTLERANRRRWLFSGLAVAVGMFVWGLGLRQALA
jgi:hypothetical protein